jgi:ElaB/YqjD/DUF883 family membrane-anchored ribosome-binding protein
MDPRVHATEAELQDLFAEQSKLADMVSKGSAASLEAHSAREQLEALSKSAQPAMKDAPTLKEAIETLDKELAGLLSGRPKADGGEAEPGLDGVAAESVQLYEQVGLADAAPTAAQLKATAHAGDELAETLKRWDRSKEASIPALNRQLDAAHLPLLNLEQKPRTTPDSGDED